MLISETNTPRIPSAAGTLAAFGYLYMAASWGAYVFISNLVPLYVLVMVAVGRYSRRLYVAYTSFWAVGSLLAMQARARATFLKFCCHLPQVRFIGVKHAVWHACLIALAHLLD